MSRGAVAIAMRGRIHASARAAVGGWIVTATLVIACGDDHGAGDRVVSSKSIAGAPDAADRSASSSVPHAGAPDGSGASPAREADVRPSSPVPELPASPDGVEEIRALDHRIELHRDEPELAIALLLDRAWIAGRLDDYVEALRRSRAWVTRAPALRRAWQTRVLVLTRVHEIRAARAALTRLRRLVRNRRDAEAVVEGLTAAIDEASGSARAAAFRAKMARDYPDPTTLTQWAASLATAGRTDEALTVMQRVPALVHDNAPQLLAWILFQWGRIYELRAESAAARFFYEAARARLPTVEITVHLAQAIAATGGDPSALVTAALADQRHPELLALAGKLDEARRAWERYVAVLPRAFSAPAARFYLGPGRDPAHALALARLDLANRGTLESRSLAVEAALATGDTRAACALAQPLRAGSPAQQFMAWRAFTSCKRADEAAALAARLGIPASADRANPGAP